MKLIEFHEPMFEMAALSRKRTNLPYELWLDSVGKDRNVLHNTPRLKVKVSDNTLIPVSIEKAPKVLVDISKYPKIKHLSAVVNFIANNYDLLLDHWNKKYDDGEIIGILTDICRGVDKDTAIKNNVI